MRFWSLWIVFLLATLPLSAQLPQGIADARVVHLETNPTGLSVGFWTAYIHSADAVRDFGLRPIERVGFTTWTSVEKSPGVYTWANLFSNEQRAHRAGATVVSAVNVSFTLGINKHGMAAIPPFYPQSIDDPQTRAAARKFLAAYVQHALEADGPLILVLDYESTWFGMPKTDAQRTSLSKWFAEGAQVCREAAAQVGRGADLKVACLSNTAAPNLALDIPLSPPQEWLQRIYDAADVCCFDIYCQDAAHPESAEPFFNEIRFFAENYTKGKPLYITENGFSSAMEDKTVKRQPWSHAMGTEAQQAAYYRNVFATFLHKEEPGYEYLRALRGYCPWDYMDPPEKPWAVEQGYCLVRPDKTLKPAGIAVREGIARLDADPALNPWKEDGRQNLKALANLPLPYTDGTDHDVLELDLAAPGKPGTLQLEFDRPVSVVVQFPDGTWLADSKEDQTTHRIAIPAATGHAGPLRIVAPASTFPVQATLKTLSYASP